MAKYKVGDIFINHVDNKILQVCEGGCYEGCCYMSNRCKGTFNIDTPYIDTSCGDVIGCYRLVKELPFLPPGTKVKVREDLKVEVKYGGHTFVKNMKHCVEVTIKQYNAAYKSYNIIEDIYNYTLEMFDQVINEPKENNMETKEIKIKVPEGYEIDKENSTFDCIKFKPVKKGLTYRNIAEELFVDTAFYISSLGDVLFTGNPEICTDINCAPNKKQLERLLALNQLLNIAEYYNKKSPKEGNKVYCINFDERNKTTEYFVSEYTRPMIVRGLIPMFNRHEDVSAVIYNPNFKAILDLVYKGDED